jgi:hypothetical protein
MKYFLLSVFSSALTLFGFSYLYGLAGTTNIAVLYDTLHRSEPRELPVIVHIAVIMTVAGLGFRITAVPFHFYAPDVYQGAPTVGAALLAFIPKVAGFAALLRVLGFVTPPGIAVSSGHIGMALSTQVPIILWFLAVVTMFLGNILALWQDNLKRLLAYSSIAGVPVQYGLYAAFASHCDAGPFVGYVVGVNATTGQRTAMWATEAGSSNAGGGIWQSGQGLVADANGDIYFMTANGSFDANTGGTSYGESFVKLTTPGLTVADYFTPNNFNNLNGGDMDLGSHWAGAGPCAEVNVKPTTGSARTAPNSYLRPSSNPGENTPCPAYASINLGSTPHGLETASSLIALGACRSRASASICEWVSKGSRPHKANAYRFAPRYRSSNDAAAYALTKLGIIVIFGAASSQQLTTSGTEDIRWK